MESNQSHEWHGDVQWYRILYGQRTRSRENDDRQTRACRHATPWRELRRRRWRVHNGRRRRPPQWGNARRLQRNSRLERSLDADEAHEEHAQTPGCFANDGSLDCTNPKSELKTNKVYLESLVSLSRDLVTLNPALVKTLAITSPKGPPLAFPIWRGPVGFAETNSTLTLLPFPRSNEP